MDEWKEALLDSDQKTDKFFERFSDNEEGLKNLLKSSLNSHKMVGANPIKRITEDSDEEAKKQYWKDIGALDSPEDYKLNDVELDNEISKVVKDFAYKNKLTENQAIALAGYFKSSSDKKEENEKITREEKRISLENKLKEEFGDKIQEVENSISNVLKFLGDDYKEVMDSDLGSDERFVRTIIKLGELLKEDNRPSETGFIFTSSGSLEIAQKNYDAMMKDDAFQQKLMKGDRTAEARYEKILRELAEAKEKSSK